MRPIALVFGLMLGFSATALERSPVPKPPGCCRMCGPKSKPCGDGCVAVSKVCHKKGGCAC